MMHSAVSTASGLMANYAAVKARLGLSVKNVTIPRTRIVDGSWLYTQKYPHPIGPRRVLFDASAPMPGAMIRSPAAARAVVKGMATAAGYEVNDVLSRRREAELVSLRARISHRLKEHGLSYPAIAAALNRDHTSIMQLIKAYKPTGERV
jgi:hypothetical protein